jgi:glycosyltransferase involved in cell wall biosynthesis
MPDDVDVVQWTFVMNLPKVLFDLSCCLTKKQQHIQRETCQLFAALMDISKLDGLLQAEQGNVFVRAKIASDRAKAIEQASYFFHNAFHHEKFYLTKLFDRLKLTRFLTRKQKQYHLHVIDKMYEEVIWRNLFSQYLPPVSKTAVLRSEYYFTDMTRQVLSSINTESYDFVIFPEFNPVRLTAGTQKIVLFNESMLDSLCLTMPQKRVQNTYFVCDSQSARDKLIALFPQLEGTSDVIENPVGLANHKQLPVSALSRIIETRRYTRDDCQHFNSSEYILGVASQETDCAVLISAWEKLNAQYPEGITLLILSNSKEISSELEHQILLHREQGRLIYLMDVPDIEKAFLFSQAKLLVNIAPLNSNVWLAMQSACPIIMLDMPVHREMLADGVNYCDVKSENELVESMARLLYSESAAGLRADLISKGLQRVNLFSPENITAKWLALFEKLTTKRQCFL